MQSAPEKKRTPIHHHVKRVIEHVRKHEDFRYYCYATLAYTAITLLMFWYLVINLSSGVINGGGDVYQSMWELWWVPHAIASSNPIYFTNLLYYPIGASLVTETLMPLAGILSAPLQLVSIAFAYNILFLLGYILSGLFACMLVLHITKNRYAAFIGGLIFAFSPMHIAQSIGHLNWTSIEFIPLFVLLFILMIKESRRRYVLGAAIAFLLVVFVGDPLQGIMALLFAVLLLLYYLATERKAILNRQFAIRLASMAIITLALGSPFLIPLIGGLLQPGTLSTANQLSNIPHNMLWSDNLLSYFLPSYYNTIFHNASSAYYNQIYGLTYKGVQYIPSVSERTSYAGYSVLFLALLAIYIDYSRNKLKHMLFWLIALVVFFLMSLGPYIQIYSSVTGIPGPYIIYRLLPILNLVREPGRFDMLVTLALSVLAAFGFASLLEGKDKKQSMMYTAVLLVIIMLEYGSMPLTAAYTNMLLANATIPSAYGQIGSVNGNFSTLILPALPNTNSTTPELYPGLAMYYDTAMHKPIIDGYTTRENYTQYDSMESVPLVVSAQYLQIGDGFIYPSPLLMNSTNATLLMLANDNTAFISVMGQAYTYTQMGDLYTYLNNVFGPPVYTNTTTSTYVFATGNALRSNAGRYLTAYTVGTWIPGFQFCGPYSACNQSIATMWWGSNQRGIAIYSPNTTSVKMGFTAIPYSSGMPLGIFLSNSQKPVAILNLAPSVSNYTVQLNLTRGMNILAFYSSNITSQTQNPYINYGIKNITLTR